MNTLGMSSNASIRYRTVDDGELLEHLDHCRREPASMFGPYTKTYDAPLLCAIMQY
jgi:hypothetical protein